MKLSKVGGAQMKFKGYKLHFHPILPLLDP